jgi:dihydrofolate reductase
MRKLKLQMQVTVDGFVATGPNDEQKWVTWAWDEIKQEVLLRMVSTDTMIIGRKLAVDFIPYWEGVANDPKDAMYELAIHNVRVRKIIFSKTLQKADWHNTEIATGDLVDEVNSIKRQPGKDIFVCGGSSFVSALTRHGLIDEYYFYINPVAIGNGDQIFNQINDFTRLKLLKSFAYPSGLVLVHYEQQR